MRGRLRDIQLPLREKCTMVTLAVDADPADVEKLQNMDLDIDIRKKKKGHSLEANSLLWACITDLAAAHSMGNWDMYLFELRRYGVVTPLMVSHDALPQIQGLFRVVDEIGTESIIDDDGNTRTMIEVLCYPGCSCYDSREFSRLIDGVISDMRDSDITPPTSGVFKAYIEELEKRERRDQAGRREKKGTSGKK